MKKEPQTPKGDVKKGSEWTKCFNLSIEWGKQKGIKIVPRETIKEKKEPQAPKGGVKVELKKEPQAPKGDVKMGLKKNPKPLKGM